MSLKIYKQKKNLKHATESSEKIKSIRKQKSDSENNTPITHGDKILYPEKKITKLQLYDYYYNIKEWILPYIINRPLTLLRCPDGYQKECFFQKHIIQSTSNLKSIAIKEKNTKSNYIYIDSSEGLLSLPQLGVLEIHPWGSVIQQLEKPDMIIFDLDPAPDVKWKQVVIAASEIKDQLKKIKLKSFIKTTGGKGLHVVVPIKPEYQWPEVKIFAHTFVEYMESTNPNLYVTTITKSKRSGKIFIDYLRNQRGATAIAPYSTRARANAPIATPISWDELTSNKKDTEFTIKTILKRLNNLKTDPWKDFFKIKQHLKLK